MNDTVKSWLVVFVCPCPNCGYPRVEYVFAENLPEATEIDGFMLGNLPCDRCYYRWQPSVHERYSSIHPQILKKDFQSYKTDK
jgi:hypothetical protein